MLEGCTPWPADFVKRYREAGYWTDQTLGDVINESAERFGPREAVVSGETRYSYHDVRRLSDRLALHFIELGLKPGDRVLSQLHNIVDFPVIFYGLQKAGIIPVACLPQFRLHEMGYFAELTNPVAYMIPDSIGPFSYSELAQEVRQKAPSIKNLLIYGDDVPAGSVSLNALLADPIEERVSVAKLAKTRPDPLNAAVLLLSGGTTGVPKLIPRTHNDALHSFKHLSYASPYYSGTVVCFTPMAHTMGLIYCMQPTLLTGGKLVIAQAPDPELILKLIEKEQATHIMSVPTILLRLIGHPSFSRYDLSSLRSVMVGGQKSHPELKRKLEDVFKVKVNEAYSMGEGFTCSAHVSLPEELRIETVGRPVSPGDEVRIVDENGNDVGEGGVGEIIARGPGVIRGYFKAPEHNAAAFDNEGYYHTGDLGQWGPLGGISVVGRRKDMINRGGEHISAEELDVLIMTHPAVVNAAVIGMLDEEMGERICAYVVTKPGQTLTRPELSAHLLSKNIAKFKLPERLEVVPEFKIIGLGKVDKKVLREDIARKLQAERTQAAGASDR